MNDDLISRKMAIDAIIDHIREKFAQRDTPLNYISGLYKAEDIIEILPSAQPEIIRCKDCKWYTVNELKKDGTDDRRYKPSYCLLYSMRMDTDWFCADGERRTDE